MKLVYGRDVLVPIRISVFQSSDISNHKREIEEKLLILNITLDDFIQPTKYVVDNEQFTVNQPNTGHIEYWNIITLGVWAILPR